VIILIHINYQPEEIIMGKKNRGKQIEKKINNYNPSPETQNLLKEAGDLFASKF